MQSKVMEVLSGRTSRTQYWLTFAGFAVAWFGSRALKDVADGTLSVSIILLAAAVVVLQTVRRLHDTGLSRWLVLLCFFPVSFTFDPTVVEFGAITLKGGDPTELLRNAPFILGLIVPSGHVKREPETVKAAMAASA